MLDSLRNLIEKAGLTASFSSEDGFSSVSFSAKKLKLSISDSSKENENNVDVTG